MTVPVEVKAIQSRDDQQRHAFSPCEAADLLEADLRAGVILGVFLRRPGVDRGAA
jgi:hypothetical protein